MRLLHFAAEIFVALKLNRLVNYMRPLFLRKIPVLAYHRIATLTDNYPFDPGLISASPEAFLEQMIEVKKYHTAVTMEQMVGYLKGVLTLPKNAVLITFDDGFDDNFHVAFPILKDLSLPATFFVTTEFIGSEEPIWFERLAYFFNKVDIGEITLAEVELSVVVSSNKSSRVQAYISVIERLKVVSNESRLRALSQLYDCYSDPYKNSCESEVILSRSMGWQHLREMFDNGMDIGSHTLSHPILSMLTEDQLSIEINDSRKILMKKLNIPVCSIAYPVGQEESFCKAVSLETRASGYSIAFSYVDGIDESDCYAIGRLHMETDFPMSILKAKISLPELFCE